MSIDESCIVENLVLGLYKGTVKIQKLFSIIIEKKGEGSINSCLSFIKTKRWIEQIVVWILI